MTCFDLGVAEVLANWQNVFRAINLATGKHLVDSIDCSEIILFGQWRGRGATYFTGNVGSNTRQHRLYH